jgi:hypothetical protein
MAKPEHVHAWQDSARLQKTCHGCETVASRERGPGGWVTTYRPTLRAETAQRLRAAGITADDAGLQQAMHHNAVLGAHPEAATQPRLREADKEAEAA